MNYSLNCRGRLLDLTEPKIMGILNLTPDSFSDGGRFLEKDKALYHAENMLKEGADILDIGGYSSRPNADKVSEEEELNRIGEISARIIRNFPEAIISIDTFRAKVAEETLKLGAHIINDISGGQFDAEMYTTVKKYKAAYILMHIQGTPDTMQINPQYKDVVEDIYEYFVNRLSEANKVGLYDIVLDLGFGFGKTIDHNYQLFKRLASFETLQHPLLVGISRKSMLYKLVEATPLEVQGMTDALHLQALNQGAKILRVHDVQSAAKIKKLYQQLK